MPTAWDSTAEKDLLLAIIERGELKQILWPAIAEHMKSQGYPYTLEGCRQHYQKIRRANKKNHNGPIDAVDNLKPRAKASSRAKTGKGSKAQDFYDNGADDEEIPPNKRRRTNPKKEEIKMEDDQAGGWGQTSRVSKMEDEQVLIDLENDDLYEA